MDRLDVRGRRPCVLFTGAARLAAPDVTRPAKVTSRVNRWTG